MQKKSVGTYKRIYCRSILKLSSIIAGIRISLSMASDPTCPLHCHASRRHNDDKWGMSKKYMGNDASTAQPTSGARAYQSFEIKNSIFFYNYFT